MDTLYERAYDAISQKARTVGADAILGFKMDFDEISGQGKQMFMISVSGTAVKLVFDKKEEVSTMSKDSCVSSIKIAKELFKERWAKRGRYTPKSSELDFIMENSLWELAPSLYDYYVTNRGETRPIDEVFPIILSTLSYDEAIAFIYNDYENRCRCVYNLLQKNKLFNATKVLEILRSNLTLGVELLEIDKKEYDHNDLVAMKEILSYLDNLPDKGKIEMTKSGILSSKMEEMYICPEGHKNNKDVVYCEGNGGYCGLNIKGLKQEQVNVINACRDKVRVLENLL